MLQSICLVHFHRSSVYIYFFEFLIGTEHVLENFSVVINSFIWTFFLTSQDVHLSYTHLSFVGMLNYQFVSDIGAFQIGNFIVVFFLPLDSYVFWMGDLNFRIADKRREEVEKYVKTGKFQTLLMSDQVGRIHCLNSVMKDLGVGFLGGELKYTCG